jgi:hypothetical protein
MAMMFCTAICSQAQTYTYGVWMDNPKTEDQIFTIKMSDLKKYLDVKPPFAGKVDVSYVFAASIGQRTALALETKAFANFQNHTIIIKDILPNGEMVLTIDGKNFRTISEEHARQIEAKNIRLDLLEKENALQARKITTLERQAAIQNSLVAKLEEKADLNLQDALLWKNNWQLERDLRLKAEQSMNRSKLTDFLNGPVMSTVTKVVVPIATLAYSMRD